MAYNMICADCLSSVLLLSMLGLCFCICEGCARWGSTDVTPWEPEHITVCCFDLFVQALRLPPPETGNVHPAPYRGRELPAARKPRVAWGVNFLLHNRAAPKSPVT